MAKRATREQLEQRVAELEQQRERDPEHRFRSVVESSPMGLHLYELEADDRLVFRGANPAADAILGIDNAQFIGQTLEQAFPPLAQTEIPERYREVCRSGEPWQTEQIDYEDDRVRGAFEVHAFQIGPRRMAAAFIEITERKRAEYEAEKAQALLLAAIEGSPAGIIIADAPDVRIRVCNNAALGIRGESALPLTDIPAALHPKRWQVFHPDGSPFAAEDLPLSQAVLHGKTSHNIEAVIRDARGTDRYILANAAPVCSSTGEVLAGVVVFPEITERKRAEGALRESEAKYRSLVDNLNVGVFRVEPGPEGRVLFANKALTRIAGYRSIEELNQKPLAEYFVRPDEKATLEDLVLSRDRQWGIPLEFKRRDGSSLWASCSLDAVRDAGGRVRYFEGILDDITERKQAEETLLESEERFRRLAEAAFEGIAISDGGKVVDANRRLAEMLGYSLTELIGRGALDFAAPDSRDLIQQHIAAGSDEPYEHLARRKDGSEFPVEIHARAIPYEGRLARITAIRDVTERVRAGQALRESEDRYRTLFEKSGMAVLLLARDSTIVDSNQTASQMLGYERHDLLERSPLDLSPELQPDGSVSKEVGYRYAEAAARDGGHRFQWQHVRSDGTLLHVDVSLTRVELNGELYLQAALQDITPAKHAQEQLRVFRDVMGRSSDAILVADLRVRRIVDVNDMTCSVLGVERDQLLAMSFEDLDTRLDPSQRPRLREALEPRGSVLVELEALREDGSRVPLEVNVRHVVEEGHEYLVAVARDISERRRVGQLQEALRRSETMSAMGRLVGGVAHEVRNPLFAISATLDAFDEDFSDHPEYQEYSELLRVEVNRLRRLMQDLLDYGRPTSTTFDTDSLSSVLEDARRSSVAQLSKAGVRLVYEVAPDLPEIRMNRPRLLQVYENLIKNAAEHSPRGGEVQVRVGLVESRGWTWLRSSIEDRGPGFAEEDLPKVFEPFFTRRRGGTGLGLSIVHKVVEEHGGSIEAANREGGGAVMTFDLPHRAGEAEAEES